MVAYKPFISSIFNDLGRIGCGSFWISIRWKLEGKSSYLVVLIKTFF